MSEGPLNVMGAGNGTGLPGTNRIVYSCNHARPSLSLRCSTAIAVLLADGDAAASTPAC